jgi:hypothetical protein
MHRRSLLILLLGMAVALSASSQISAAPLADNQTVKLPCGRTIKILSVSRIEYSKGVPALMVRYQTTLSVEAQRKALSDEVDDVFTVAQKQVEGDGFHEAIISSNEIPKGIFVTANRMLNFIFEKGADGKWTRLGRSEFVAAQ